MVNKYLVGAVGAVGLVGITLGLNYLIRGPEVVKQRFTGSEVMSVDIGTRVQDTRYMGSQVLFCEGKDNCFSRTEFESRLETKLDALEAKALKEAKSN